jgi:hypothetical protein
MGEGQSNPAVIDVTDHVRCNQLQPSKQQAPNASDNAGDKW